MLAIINRRAANLWTNQQSMTIQALKDELKSGLSSWHGG